MENLIDFFYEISKLKELNRTGWIERNIIPSETVGSHTFGVLFLVWLFSKEYIDMEKAFKMTLVHDLLECVTGDITPGQYDKNERDMIEEKALKKLMSIIPHNIKNEIIDLYHEYNDNKTKESNIVRSCDKIDMVLQALYYAETNLTDTPTVIEFLESAKRYNLDSLPDTILKTIEEEIEKIKIE
jgi:putative hydrolase of HD superfamily